MNKSEHFEEVKQYITECDGCELKLFNGEWCVYIPEMTYPFNFISVETFYNKYMNNGEI